MQIRKALAEINSEFYSEGKIADGSECFQKLIETVGGSALSSFETLFTRETKCYSCDRVIDKASSDRNSLHVFSIMELLTKEEGRGKSMECVIKDW